jgi:hypothetical protein
MPAIRSLAIACGAMAALLAAAIAPEAKPLVSSQAGPQAMCPEVEMPVCGIKNGRYVRYGNRCKARRAGATDITPGDCPTGRTIAPMRPRPR